MNRRDFVVSMLAGGIGLSAVARADGQARTIRPDLAALADGKRLNLFNRTATRLVDGARTGARLNAAAGDGVAFLPGIDFANGTIEFDVRGKDVAQQSFVGVAFHGANENAFDTIYFRPFNFRTTDPLSHGHQVQYTSLPVYTWDKLRADHPGQYEQPVNPVPDPTAWFHARVVVAYPKVSVFVGDAKDPCLVVDALNGRKTGMVGVWAGNGSDGDFANFSIISA
jgi:hypothetical protein